MLRLLKKYTFGYHVLPILKTAAPVPGKSIVMSSYPGALSSHDEFYLTQGQSRELIVAGIPLAVANHHELWNFTKTKDQVNETNVRWILRILAPNEIFEANNKERLKLIE